jgi:hypothetical protein
MRKTKQSFYKRYRLPALIAGTIVVAIAILELTNTTHIFHKQTVPPVITAHTNSGSPINSTDGSTPQSASSNAESDSTNGSVSPTPTDSNHTLIAPFGNFVSNHYPGQNSSPTTESSVCNSTPGAKCYIKFTNSAGQTTQLPTQSVDSHGSTSWYWDIHKDAHLNTGQWQVTAVATLGNQIKSTDDTLKLAVQ